MKNKKEEIKIGDIFIRSGTHLTVEKFNKENAILHRSYRGIKKIFEQVPVNHLLTLKNTYRKMEVK